MTEFSRFLVIILTFMLKREIVWYTSLRYILNASYTSLDGKEISLLIMLVKLTTELVSKRVFKWRHIDTHCPQISKHRKLSFHLSAWNASFVGMKRRGSRHETHRLSACNFHAAWRNVFVLWHSIESQRVTSFVQIVLYFINKAFFRVKKLYITLKRIRRVDVLGE